VQLVEFSVKNFKSLENLVLTDIGPFNIFVGKNNTGKSTILDALEMFLRYLDQQGPQLDDHVWTRGAPEKPITFSATFLLHDDDLQAARTAKVPYFSEADHKSPLQVKVARTVTETRVWSAAGVKCAVSKKPLSLQESTTQHQGPYKAIVEFLKFRIQGVKRIDVIRGQIENLDSSNGLRGILIPHQTLVTVMGWRSSRTDADRKKLERLNAIFQNLTGKDWKLDVLGNKLCLLDGGYEAEIRTVGGGIQEMVHLAYELVDAPRVLMVEEPEAHSHPGQAKVVFRILKDLSKDHQVFVTTHSTVFLESAGFSDVFNVRMSDGKTTCTKVDQGSFENVALDLGITPKDLYMAGGFLFVEGLSDEIIVKSWGKLFGVSLEFPDVSILRMEGMDRAKYTATVWLQIIESVKVPIAWIFDKSDRVSELQRELISKGVEQKRIIILDRGEIEDCYPGQLFAQYLADRYGLADRLDELGELMNGPYRVRRITEYLRNNGNPQPEGDEWKVGAAKYISANGGLDEYSEQDTKDIESVLKAISSHLGLAH